MRRQTFCALFAAVLVFTGAGSSALAGPTPAPDKDAPAESDPIFQRGTFELQGMEGLIYSQQKTGDRRPNIDYQLTALRVGYMADSPHWGGTSLRGNDEFLIEAVGGYIFQGPGHGLGGLSLLYRRNFLSPGARLVPYLNLGGGGVYCDAYHNRYQQALGSGFEFDLQASVGLRWRLGRRLTLDAEAAYRHLSNAHLAERNLGTNGVGGLVGVSYSF